MFLKKSELFDLNHWVFFSLILLNLVSLSLAQAVTLVHTNDVQGDIEPCGCRTNPQGGMARKFNLLKRIQDPWIIQVDSGDLLFSTRQIPPLLADQAKLQAEYLLKAMELTHHDIVVPGEKDFALGLSTFEKLIQKSPIHFLASNLKRRNGKAFLQSHVILKGKSPSGSGVRVGVFGVVGEDLDWPKGLQVSSAIQAARKQVLELRPQTDYIVAVSHLGLEADQKLAAKVPGIDVIVGAHSQSFLQSPAQVGATQIVQSSFRNQYIGVMPLTRPLQLNNYQLTGLDAGYDSPQDAPTPMDELVREFKKAIGDLNSRSDLILSESQGTSKTKFQTFTQCAGCHLKQFDFWRKTPHFMALEPLLQKHQEKNKECLQCHTVGLGDPNGFLDVNRLAELIQGQESVSGADGAVQTPVSTEQLGAFLRTLHEAPTLKSSGKVSSSSSEPNPLLKLLESRSISGALRSVSRSWAPVQCENCHLPGQNHPFSAGYSKKVETNVCLKCHTSERAPDWYLPSGQPDGKLIDSKRSLITCPAGDLSEVED